MTLRDALQTELWSKQTSRKILKVGGISFAALLLTGVIVAWAELKWITPPERSAARAALTQIEHLRQAGGISEDEYNTLKGNADGTVQKAEGAAWTVRDKSVAISLHGYLFLTEMRHEEPLRRAAANEFYRHHPDIPRLTTRLQQDQDDEESRQVEEFIREVLHRTLD